MDNHIAIPKTIHYCWFGDAPLGDEEKKCIESWRKFLPDYEIRRWDESNFDFNVCDYSAEAYEAEKWAFVSDYARFAILYELGGLYFDTDVEIIRPLDDIIGAGPFMGFERDADSERGLAVAPGLGLAAEPGLEIYGEILAAYHRCHFLGKDGKQDLTTVVSRVTDILKSHGLNEIRGIQHVCGINIYPAEYFNPKDYLTGAINVTENTRAIHHFSMSWLSEGKQYTRKLAAKLSKAGLPATLARVVARLISTVRYGEYRDLAHSISKKLDRKRSQRA